LLLLLKAWRSPRVPPSAWRRLFFPLLHAMTKSQLIQIVGARHSHLAPNDGQVAVDLLLNAIAVALAKAHRVEIRGFGSFCLNYRPARTARNPKTGEKVRVPPKYVPHFKAGKALRARANYKVE
jgi:integration host factor subunit beta